MKELREIYEQVKNHPYRRNEEEKYLKSYRDLLYKLGDAFYLAVKDTKYKSAGNMIHDFNGSISNLSNKYQALHVERCIGTIHIFLDTGKVLYFYTYYTGGNTLSTLPRVCKEVYDEKDGKYYADYSINELKDSIEVIEKKWKEHPEYRKYQFSPYGEYMYNWLKSLLERKLSK